MSTRKTYRLTRALLCVMAFMALVVLGACAPSTQQESSSDTAAKNRSYMARINQQMASLDEALAAFQTAVGADDAVAMQASQLQAGHIIDEVKADEAPEMLKDVKEGYVAGLEQLRQALADYVQLSNDAHAGWLDEESYNQRLSLVQASYDAGIAALGQADQAALAIANASSSASSSSAASSSSSLASSQASDDAQDVSSDSEAQ